MGVKQSKQTQTPPAPPSPPLLAKPWRKILGWSEDVRRDLKEHVAGLAPQIPDGKEQVPFYNILLTGQSKAGKSSFYNSLNGVFIQRIVAKADVGELAQSLTTEFRIYEMRLTPTSEPLSWRICDTMGLDYGTTNETDVRNILKAVDGHVPDRFVFNKEREIVPDSPGYINVPSLADKAHCVAVVIDASIIEVMEDTMWSKLKSLRKALIDRNIPTYILLTHIDEACPEVKKAVKNVYHSSHIEKCVKKVGKRLHGLPENQIFPVMNYKEQVDLEDSMDILLLYPLRQMLYSAQGHLENKL